MEQHANVSGNRANVGGWMGGGGADQSDIHGAEASQDFLFLMKIQSSKEL